MSYTGDELQAALDAAVNRKKRTRKPNDPEELIAQALGGDDFALNDDAAISRRLGMPLSDDPNFFH